MTIRTLRANGVNTPVVITDEPGEAQLPLLVQYPVERNGRLIETAYYMSTHPGIITPEVVNAGRFYVHNVIDIARDRSEGKGIFHSAKGRRHRRAPRDGRARRPHAVSRRSSSRISSTISTRSMP